VREEAICAKVYRRTDRRTDRQTDDGRHAIALAHSWNELKIITQVHTHQQQARRESGKRESFPGPRDV